MTCLTQAYIQTLLVIIRMTQTNRHSKKLIKIKSGNMINLRIKWATSSTTSSNMSHNSLIMKKQFQQLTINLIEPKTSARGFKQIMRI